jgi:hypothetical protein
VTTFGLQPLYSNQSDERYEAYLIPAVCLLRMHDRGPVYFWPVRVAAQPWLDLDGFEEAFRKALEIHSRKYGLVPDDHTLATSFRRARGMQRSAVLPNVLYKYHHGRPPPPAGECPDLSQLTRRLVSRVLGIAHQICGPLPMLGRT